MTDPVLTRPFRIPCSVCGGEDAHWFPRAYLWKNLKLNYYSTTEDPVSGSTPLCARCAKSLDFRRAAVAAINAGLVTFATTGEVTYKGE